MMKGELKRVLDAMDKLPIPNPEPICIEIIDAINPERNGVYELLNFSTRGITIGKKL